MPDDRISIALATYNGASFLVEQLQSIAAQTVLPFELVVSDDGSSDETLTIVDRFAATALFEVVVLREPLRLGYRRNFRRAASHCRGDLIAFSDQDDVWHPQKLEKLRDVLRDPDALLAYHNARVNGEGVDRPLYDGSEERNALAALENHPFKLSAGMTQMFRSTLRRFDDLWDGSIDHNERDVLLAHDQWYFFLSLIEGGVRYVDEMLIDYRQHGSNAWGAHEHWGLFKRLRMKFLHYGQQDDWMAKSSLSRAAIIRQIACREGRNDLVPVADLYQHYGERLRRRAETYSRSTLLHRAQGFGRAVVKGDYGVEKLKFGPQGIVRDMWSGVILGRAIDPTR